MLLKEAGHAKGGPQLEAAGTIHKMEREQHYPCLQEAMSEAKGLVQSHQAKGVRGQKHSDRSRARSSTWAVPSVSRLSVSGWLGPEAS